MFDNEHPIVVEHFPARLKGNPSLNLWVPGTPSLAILMPSKMLSPSLITSTAGGSGLLGRHGVVLPSSLFEPKAAPAGVGGFRSRPARYAARRGEGAMSPKAEIGAARRVATGYVSTAHLIFLEPRPFLKDGRFVNKRPTHSGSVIRLEQSRAHQPHNCQRKDRRSIRRSFCLGFNRRLALHE
jgi:hypothetical protein